MRFVYSSFTSLPPSAMTYSYEDSPEVVTVFDRTIWAFPEWSSCACVPLDVFSLLVEEEQEIPLPFYYSNAYTYGSEGFDIITPDNPEWSSFGRVWQKPSMVEVVGNYVKTYSLHVINTGYNFPGFDRIEKFLSNIEELSSVLLPSLVLQLFLLLLLVGIPCNSTINKEV